MEGEERKGVERPLQLRAQVHSGENDCSTVPGNSRKTFPRYLRDFRMLNINSFFTPTFRATMYKVLLSYNKSILILVYFIDAYW